MIRQTRRRGDGGFTLIELLIVVVIMGVITLPLGNFMLAYFKNVTQTQERLSDSHDAQIATAYFSQDVGNTGVRGLTAPYAPQQSVWTTGFPAGYCGNGLGGVTILVLRWDDPGGTGSNTIDSASYIVLSGALHRIYCTGAMQTDATLVHNLAGGDPTVTCSSACEATPPPAKVMLTFSVRNSADASVTLTGQRRQATS